MPFRKRRRRPEPPDGALDDVQQAGVAEAVRLLRLDAAALVLHDMRREEDGTRALLGFYATHGSDLTMALATIAEHVAQTIASERGTPSDAVIEDAAATFDGRDTPAVNLALSFSAGDVDGGVRILEQHAGNDLVLAPDLVRLVRAVFGQMVGFGDSAAGVDGDPGFPLTERLVMQYALWLATQGPAETAYADHHQPLPCYVCARSANGRDPQGRPHHVLCVVPGSKPFGWPIYLDAATESDPE